MKNVSCCYCHGLSDVFNENIKYYSKLLFSSWFTSNIYNTINQLNYHTKYLLNTLYILYIYRVYLRFYVLGGF